MGTLGYYGAYVYVIWRAVHHVYDIGTFFFITNAIIQASSNLQQVFTTASGIADQALFLTDLIAFFAMQPVVRSRAECAAAAEAHPQGIRVPQCLLCLSRHGAGGVEATSTSACIPGTGSR